ncbi:MAG: helix-turn-helix transcriptional regulator [Bacilli bacterium]
MIRINLNVMLAKRRMKVTELTKKVGLTYVNASTIKNERIKAIKISTLDKICEVLDCQPGDIFEYVDDKN